MKKRDKYNKLIKVLKENKPQPGNHDQLAEQIMNRIDDSGNIGNDRKSINAYAFRWATIGWVRIAMASAASLLIGMFVIQQITINHRISSLEDQLIKIVNPPPEPAFNHKALLEAMVEEKIVGDSIMVSRADLEKLLDAYIESDKQNRSILGNPSYNSYFRELINSWPEKIEEDGNLINL